MSRILVKQINNSVASEGAAILFDGTKNLWSNQSTGALLLPSGTTAQQPGSPVGGEIRYNTDTGALETFYNSNWATIKSWTIKNQVIVQLDPGPGEFASINAALASITTASASNPFEILVGPGVFTETTINMKPYVAVVGISRIATIIQAAATNQHVIVGAEFSQLTQCVVTGATDPGFCGIYFSNTSSDPDASFLVEDVRLGNNDILTMAEGITQNSVIFFHNAEIGGSYQFNRGFISKDSGAAAKITLLSTRSHRGIPLPLPTDVFSAEGPNAQLVVNSAQIKTFSLSTGACAQVSDGGTLFLFGMDIEGFGKGIWMQNVGAGPKVFANAIFLEGNTQDFVVDHPGAVGTFEGSSDMTKISVDPAASIGIDVTDVSGIAGSVVLSGMYQGDRWDELLNISLLIRESSTLGIFKTSGTDMGETGQLPPITLVSGLTVNVAPGSGFLENPTGLFTTQVTWTSTNLTLPADSTNYIYVDENSTVQYAASPTWSRQSVVLGRVRTEGVAVDFIENSFVAMNHYSNNIEDALRAAIGAIFVSGCATVESGTRQLTVGSGEYYYGTDKFLPMGGSPVTFTTYYRDGSGGWVSTTGQTTVDNANYDNGSGTLQPLTTSYYVKHALYVIGDPANENYYLVYGQNQYQTLVQAEGGADPLPPSWFGGALVKIAGIIVQQGVTNISEIRDERPRVSFAPSALSVPVFHNQLLGLLNDDHTQYLLVNGSRAMSGNLNMGTNNITNVGTVNGVTVEAHASRHLPNGADPLTTAAPTTTLTANTTNATGTANSLSRSDHTHAISTDGALSVGTANSSGTASTLIRSDHVHQGIHSLKVDAGSQRFGDIVLASGTNISIVDGGTGTFTFNITGTLAAAQFPALTGDVTTTAGSLVTTISNNAVTNAKFRQSAGLSVVGNSTNATANVADITASTANQVLVVNPAGTALIWSTVQTGGIANSAVTYAKIQNESASTLLGNPTGSSTAPSEITLGSTLTFSGSALQTVAHTGDVTTSANSFVTTIANSAVTNAKLANMANNTVKGNNSGISAAPSDLTASNVLDMIGAVQGDVLYRNASDWVVLAPGTSGQVLTTGGTGANPSWTTNGSGTVTNIATGSGLTGGPITSTGTISVLTNGITNSLFRQSTANTIVGNPTGSTANVTDITLGSTLTFSAGALQTTALSGDVTTSANSFVTTLATVNSNVGTFTALTVNAKGLVTAATNLALTGDVTGTASGSGLATTIANNAVTTAKINNSAVTYAKIQNETASTLLGNPTGSATAPSEITLGTTLAFSGSAIQTAAITGDVTASANSFATTVAKINGVALGTTTATSGNLLIGSGTAWVTQAMSGDATISSTGVITVSKTGGVAFAASATTDTTNASNITSGSLSLARIATIANNTLLANISGGVAAPAATTLTALIDSAIGSVQGDILYRNASSWVVLAPGTNGQVLTTGGAAANPTWTTNGAGTVTSVTFTGDGTLLSATPSSAVTSTGTLTATLANATGGSVLGRAAGTTGAPTYTSSPVLGINASVAGTLGLANGAASGTTITLQNLGNTTAYNFNLPTSAGSAGQVLTSQAGGSTSMTWTTPTTGTVTSVATGSGLTGGTITSTGTISVSANGITNALFRQSGANTIVGNPTGSTANVTDITLGATLTFSSGVLQTAAHTGDVTTSANSFVTTLATVNSNIGTFTALTVNAKGLVTAATNLALTGDVTGTASGSGLATTIANNAVTTAKINNAAVTYAKIQNESANTILGNPTGSAAAPSEITLGTDLSFVAGALTHTNSGVTAGTYNQVTVDSQGHVTSGTTGFMPWNTITTATTAVVNNGYITNNTTLVTLTLPSTAAVGDIIPVVGRGTGGWKIAQNSGQTIHFGRDDTTTGTGGNLSSNRRYDCVELVCIIANTDFVVRSSVGNIDVN